MAKIESLVVTRFYFFVQYIKEMDRALIKLDVVSENNRGTRKESEDTVLGDPSPEGVWYLVTRPWGPIKPILNSRSSCER